jgi:hypothetical protein
MKILIIEKANEEALELHWPLSQDSKQRLNLDDTDIKMLESGKVVWVGDMGISLEDVAE